MNQGKDVLLNVPPPASLSKVRGKADQESHTPVQIVFAVPQPVLFIIEFQNGVLNGTQVETYGDSLLIVALDAFVEVDEIVPDSQQEF